MIVVSISMMLAYLLGSISPSYLLGKCLKGIDLREHGSGNVGATNAFRVLGKGPGMATLLFDTGKGFLAVRGIGAFFETHAWISIDPLLYQILLGLSVIVGHNWTVFLKFKGGKGVATSLGVFLALAPRPVIWAILIWLLVTGMTRKVALGSLAAAVAIPILMVLFHQSRTMVLFGILTAGSIFHTHRSNIQKIFLNKNL